MSKKINEFAKVKQLVETVLKKYREVRVECGISDSEWHSRSIERMANPFIKGYFTLAIVGKVSSGKSTFINALLGCKGLLPTGHDQTTSGITYIEYGEKPEVTIKFGDGHSVNICDDISGKIKPHVAIPEKYHNLPVNTIDDMILGGYDFEKIWEVHKQVEEETQCAKIDKSLLNEYVRNRKKKDIAIEVRLKYPFNEELKGWRVIDTPGIGAIGGIETRTKQLLATQKEDGSREVDAIIFLQDGSQTLDQTDTKVFVNEQLENLTESDRHRLFYVLTHSSDTDFLNHKNSKLDFIKQNYGEKMKCLTYADSLLYTFINDLKESDVDLKCYDEFDKPDEWAEDEWDVIMGILDHAKRYLKKGKKTFNNDTMLLTLEEWAHFEDLKSQINEFAKNEKQRALRQLLNLIAKDYLGFIRQLDTDKKLVDGDLRSINNAIKKTEDKRKGYNNIARKADETIRYDEIATKFKFIDDELSTIANLPNINLVRTAITNLFDKTQKEEKKLFEEIIKIFSDFFNEYDSKDLVLESLDFSSIEREAENKSYEQYEISPEKVITHTTNPDERIPAKYGTRINKEQKLKNFKSLALKRARSQRDSFLKQVKEKAENMRNKVFEELDIKLNAEKARFENLKGQLSKKEEFKAQNDAYIESSHIAANQLIKLAEDYGIKF